MKQQQKYVALAFVYGDNRDYIDLLDPEMFGDYSSVISIVKQNRTRDEIWSAGLAEGCMDEMIECDLDIAFHFRFPGFRQEFLKLWEMYIDDKFKKTKNKLNADSVRRTHELYEKLKKRVEGKKDDDIFDETFKYIEMAKMKTGVRTGIDWLDAKIGWLRSGTITRLNGYANTGKSRFMYRVMVNILKQGKKIHLISLEVPKGMVMINLVGAYYEINTNEVESGRYDEKVVEFYEKYSDMFVIEDDKISLTDIEASVTQNDADCIFIDYVQNIRAVGKSEYEIMTKIAQDLQKMALITKKPFFDLSQVSNDGVGYKVGDMIPSKGTGAFVHACDLGLVLYKGDESGQLKLSIAKNKFGNKDIEFILGVDMGKCIFNKIADNTFGKN